MSDKALELLDIFSSVSSRASSGYNLSFCDDNRKYTALNAFRQLSSNFLTEDTLLFICVVSDYCINL